MELLNCVKRIENLYGYACPDRKWTVEDNVCSERLIETLEHLLEQEKSVEMLERCALEDLEWRLPVDIKLKLLAKAKKMGANSPLFLLDYHTFRASVTPPSPEYDEDLKKMNDLMEKYPDLKDTYRSCDEAMN